MEPLTTTIDDATSPPPPRTEPVAMRSGAARAWERLESWLARAGDWLNPILVKESRQALKSWQFTMTFVLVLIACWLVTIGGVAIIGPGIYYEAVGGNMLLAYFMVLAAPLVVIVPYATFRSLAAEREDNTYDVLSITTLRPWQIISGKLGSSVVQMAVYFSAVAPCLAFTYLLRGVDVPTIAVLLIFTFFISLGLSMLGLLLATLTVERFAQVFLSVAFVGVLMMTFYIVVMMAIQMVGFGLFVWSDILPVSLLLGTLFATTFALAFLAAAGMITFTSENRATPLRIAMLVQQAAIIGWGASLWLEPSMSLSLRPVVLVAMFFGGYWLLMGALLTGERPEMSRRVKRSLPQSFLGRVFLTWLNPGPGSGYMFAVANASAIVVLGLLAAAISDSTSGGGGWPDSEQFIYLLILGWSYLAAYLGVGRLAIAALRRLTSVTMMAAVLIHFLLVLAGSGIPVIVQSMSRELRDLDYTYLQITNPFWSLKHIADVGLLTDGWLLLTVVPAAAVCVLLANMPAVVKEMREVRVTPPPRVVEDEAELHPPPEAGPQSPWDEP